MVKLLHIFSDQFVYFTVCCYSHVGIDPFNSRIGDKFFALLYYGS